MAKFHRGDLVLVPAGAVRLPRRALGDVEVHGHEWPVVWTCTEEEWVAAMTERRDPLAIAPYPADDVTLAKH